MTPLELSKKYKTILNKAKINTPLRLSHFFGQLEAESGLKPISENLNYSAKRLLEIFPKYFKTLQEAKNYEKKPQAIGNRVYGGRMGNGLESTGEGYKYRGRGFIMTTGKDNYKALTKDTGIDYVNNPDLLLTEADSIIAAINFWTKINGNLLADKDDIDSISDLINIGRKTSKYGDANGFKHRLEAVTDNKKIFGA